MVVLIVMMVVSDSVSYGGDGGEGDGIDIRRDRQGHSCSAFSILYDNCTLRYWKLSH